MGSQFRVRIAQAPTPELIHRLRNLGEDIHRVLGDKGRIDMAELDIATEFFIVEVTASRYVGDIATVLKKQVANSSRDGAFVLERF